MFLRNATSENRITRLALLIVHRDIKVDPEDVLNRCNLQKSHSIYIIVLNIL